MRHGALCDFGDMIAPWNVRSLSAWTHSSGSNRICKPTKPVSCARSMPIAIESTRPPRRSMPAAEGVLRPRRRRFLTTQRYSASTVPSVPAAPAERAVGARLQVGVDVVDVGFDVPSPAKPFITDVPLPCPCARCGESLRSAAPIRRGGPKGRTHRVGAVTMIAARMIAPETVIGLRVDFAVDDPVELAEGLAVLRNRCDCGELAHGGCHQSAAVRISASPSACSDPSQLKRLRSHCGTQRA